MSRAARLGPVAAIVGFLAFVEFTSGILQGYYTPLLTDIARHLGIHDADVNWLEGTQLMLSALVVPAFAKLGDMVGHKRMLAVVDGVHRGRVDRPRLHRPVLGVPRRLGTAGLLRGLAAPRDRAHLVAQPLGRPPGRR